MDLPRCFRVNGITGDRLPASAKGGMGSYLRRESYLCLPMLHHSANCPSRDVLFVATLKEEIEWLR